MTKSEQLFEGRFWFGIVVVCSAFSLGIVSIKTFQYINSQTEAKVGTLTFAETEPIKLLSQPVESRIVNEEKELSQTTDDKIAQSKKVKIANLYAQLSNQSISKGQLTTAEAALQKASAYDPENPYYAASLANLYQRAALSDKGKDQRAELYSNAADNWQTARKIAHDTKLKSAYLTHEARARVDAATLFVNNGKSAQAKSELTQLQSLTVQDPELQEEVLRLARSLSMFKATQQ